MKDFFKVACLFFCLCGITSCDTISNVSSTIENIWSKIFPSEQKSNLTDAERAAADTLTDAPGEPLLEEDRLRIAGALGFAKFLTKFSSIPTPTQEQQLEAQAVSDTLTSRYPFLNPINPKAWKGLYSSDAPTQIEGYTQIKRETVPQVKKEYEEAYPGVYLAPHESYFKSSTQWKNAANKLLNIQAIDRGNYGGWARSARWYYLRKGFVSKEYQKSYTFSGTIDNDGVLWVVWTAQKGGQKRYTTLLFDRFEVIVEGARDPGIYDMVYDISWMVNYAG